MKKIISIFTAVIIIFGCLPLMSYAVSADEETVYTKNTDEVYFSSAYAQVGKPISVEVKSGETELIYKWYIDNEQISNYGNSYTPIEADIESMLTAEVYTADGELLGSANMLISLLPVMYIETENREDIVTK